MPSNCKISPLIIRDVRRVDKDAPYTIHSVRCRSRNDPIACKATLVSIRCICMGTTPTARNLTLIEPYSIPAVRIHQLHPIKGPTQMLLTILPMVPKVVNPFCSIRSSSQGKGWSSSLHQQPNSAY
ncbi:hypothetical protein VNO77_02895 [Canavalia gladiata]|uniref:Uncharacterized protein n=1 Tax=Canavalia gladiata TaxID=3824 RepID=A0AAN9N0A1_CANGL